MTAPTEKELDAALESALKDDPAFFAWFLEQTPLDVQGATYHWSRADHPWGTIDFVSLDAGTGLAKTERRECETDVLLVIDVPDGRRCALHIENKLGAGAFTSDQPQMYRQRAEQWANQGKYRNYSSFATVLVAPERFRERQPDQCAHFDCFISHEQLATRLPAFGANDAVRGIVAR